MAGDAACDGLTPALSQLRAFTATGPKVSTQTVNTSNTELSVTEEKYGRFCTGTFLSDIFFRAKITNSFYPTISTTTYL